MYIFANKKLNASFTIEAAVVIPISMVIMVTMIFVAFYMHDRIVIRTAGEAVILENAAEEEEDASSMQAQLAEYFSNKILMTKNLSASVEETEEGYKASGSGSFNIPLGMASKILENKLGTNADSTLISNLNGRQTLLKYKAICDGLESAGFIGGSEDEQGK